MAVTPVYGFPYQGLTEAPHGPNLGLNGFTAVENKFVTVDAAIAGLPDIPTGHAGRTAGFEAISAVNGAYVTLASQDLTGGMTFASNGLVVPRTGRYRITSKIYLTGGAGYTGSFGAVINSTALPAPTPSAGLGLVHKPDALDYTYWSEVTRSLTVGDTVRLWASSVGSTWGTDGYNGSYLELEYVRP